MHSVTTCRDPLLVETKVIWVGRDEGGLGGSDLEMKPFQGESKYFKIESKDYDIVFFSALLRHQGLLIVGTNHGLFSLNELSGHFQRFDFGTSFSGLTVTSLVSHDGHLWVFIGKEWLRVDVKNRKAAHYINSTPTPLETGIPFDNAWLLGGPSGVWKYQFISSGKRVSNPLSIPTKIPPQKVLPLTSESLETLPICPLPPSLPQKSEK